LSLTSATSRGLSLVVVTLQELMLGRTEGRLELITVDGDAEQACSYSLSALFILAVVSIKGWVINLLCPVHTGRKSIPSSIFPHVVWC
jgi:hypothetical protein